LPPSENSIAVNNNNNNNFIATRLPIKFKYIGQQILITAVQ